MAYVYTSLKNVKPNSTPNFYGKIVFMARSEQKVILLLKDETGCMYVWIEPKKDEELKFELRQVVRIHRCHVGLISDTKEGVARIGVAGCHLIAWPPFGDAPNPTVKSSRTWTQSPEDKDKIETLSELGKNADKTTVEQVAEKLVGHREHSRAEQIVAGWWHKSRLQYRQRLARTSEVLFNKPVGSVIKSDNEFSADTSYLDNVTREGFMRFVHNCSECSEINLITLPDDTLVKNCNVCGKSAEDVTTLVRFKVVTRNCHLYFLITDNTNNNNPAVEQLADDLKEKLRTNAIKNIKGVVVSRSEKTRVSEIYLQEYELFQPS